MSDHSLDACLQLVADRRRRRIIDQLRDEAGGRATFDDLVDRLHDAEPTDGDGTDRERLAVRLHHTDLPKLADHGIVAYDRDTGVVEYRSSDRIEAVLDALPEDTPVANA